MHNKKMYLVIFFAALLIACSGGGEQPVGERIAATLGATTDPESPFYVNRSGYPEPGAAGFEDLPVGVFDSGTGGLTVLEAILNYDGFSNATHDNGADGIPDLAHEHFVYLGDMANMPYGNYSSEGRTDFLEELSVKDALFLLDREFHRSPDSEERAEKPPAKIVVIACNTATAYGKEAIDQAVGYLGLDVDVIGVVPSGAKGALELLDKNDSGTIGVMATVGTVGSEAYVDITRNMLEEEGYTGHIDIVQQGGLGIAEAIDLDPDYIDLNWQTTECRPRYKGPDVGHVIAPIRGNMLPAYNFSNEGAELLTEELGGHIEAVQLNSVRNYVRYHVTELLLKMKERDAAPPLRSVILGCTHYPYVEDEITAHLNFLKQYRDESGERPFAELLANDVPLVDPAELTARETYLADTICGEGDRRWMQGL